MKGHLEFDPQSCDYGPATLAVRQILTEWAAIDWFAAENDAAPATAFFRDHHEKARAVMPDAFSERLRIACVNGTWTGFNVLCTIVRGPNRAWDWKFSALKKLSYRHSRERGWSLKDHAREVTAESPPKPSDLFFRIGEAAIWNGIGPKIAFHDLSREDAEIASWYQSYAAMDLVECLEWQLAEGNDLLDENPFLPLLRCYGAGRYPFGLAADEVVLFGFTDRAQATTQATS
jgi:hypothetical protein